MFHTLVLKKGKNNNNLLSIYIMVKLRQIPENQRVDFHHKAHYNMLHKSLHPRYGLRL